MNATTRELDSILGDIWDSRDVIERAEELESAAAEEPSDLGCTLCGEGSTPNGEHDALCTEHGEELRTIRAVIEECSEVADWEYGALFIAESYFTEYARQLAEDIGAVNADASWPNSFIDWDAAADALSADYSEFRVEGATYFARA